MAGNAAPAALGRQNLTISMEDVTDTACTVREQDRFMPIANVIRIMRKILPAHAKISDDAKETIQECVSEYISFITSEANDRCQREQRKTITAEDVLWAMGKLGFDEYIEPLTVYLRRYREVEGERERGSIRGDTFMRRSVELAPVATTATPFSPTFHVGHHRHQVGHPGMIYGPMGAYFRDGSATATATATNPGQQPPMGPPFDPYAQFK
ncbi:hypothetical protein GIB67_013429 [Kingdonia uniflora]|uniref:Transcription factor CBF/NF-Y/archaeal histone domain-containing protein n=1 Tax=Kingdonia uniflora TaxID=39325 RepID=A0A7J7LRA5_9MAGN|nr:hypothetical protein GIB67_013429 [Kingdonia uniflora]